MLELFKFEKEYSSFHLSDLPIMHELHKKYEETLANSIDNYELIKTYLQTVSGSVSEHTG